MALKKSLNMNMKDENKRSHCRGGRDAAAAVPIGSRNFER